jgi:hypothetical protein
LKGAEERRERQEEKVSHSASYYSEKYCNHVKEKVLKDSRGIRESNGFWKVNLRGMLKLDEKESGQTTGCISYMRINHDH